MDGCTNEEDMEVDEPALGSSSDEPLPFDEMAELYNKNGNQLYKNKEYQQALPFYTEAIGLCPDSSAYYGNRSACYLMLHQYRDALDDARKSVALDSSYIEGYIRFADCSLALGDLSAADNAISVVKHLSPNNEAIIPEVQKLEIIRTFVEEANKAYHKEDYRNLIFCMDQLLLLVPYTTYKLMKAEFLAFLGQYQEAQEIANDILLIDKDNADAFYIHGKCLYYQDNVEQAIPYFHHVLQLAPDHQGAMNICRRAEALKQKKEEGNKAFKSARLIEAYNLYSEAIKIDPNNKSTNAKLFFNRATVCSKLGHLNEAVADCSSALDLDENYQKALLRRAKCYMELGDFDEAVRDYKRALKMANSEENQRLLQEAELASKKSKFQDYYCKILGVDKNASPDEIKKAYRKRALDHHPGDIDPNSVFQAFFAEPGGSQFSFTSGSFPGGFTFQFG